MPEVVGEAIVNIVTDASGVSTGAVKAAEGAGTQASKGFMSKFGGGLKSMWSNFGPMLTVAAGAEVIKGSIDAATEAQKVTAQTNAELKATKEVAGVSAEAVNQYAESMSKKVGVDKETIQSGENVMLTFKNIRNEAGKGNDIFNQANTAALNLSAAGFGSVHSASVMLGKALSDPAKGVSALQRVGVNLTDHQKAMVAQMLKTNNTLGAQKLVLHAVEGQVGGVAAATATSTDKMKVAWGAFEVSLGTALLPVIGLLAQVMTTLVVPALNIVVKVVGITVHLLGTLAGFIKDNAVAFGLLAAAVLVALAPIILTNIQVALAIIRFTVYEAVTNGVSIATKAWAVANDILNASLLANPVGIIIVSLIALAALFVLLYKRSETFRNIVNGVWKSVRAGVTAFIAFFRRLPQFFSSMWKAVEDHWRTALKVLLTIMFPFPALALAIWHRWGSNITNAISNAWSRVRDMFHNAMSSLSSIAHNIVSNVTSIIGNLAGNLRNAAGNAVSAITSVMGRIPGAVRNIADNALSAGKSVGSSIMQGVKNGLSAAGGLVSDLASNIKQAVNSGLGLPHHIGFSIMHHTFGVTIPALAHGALDFPGGFARVGERGPETVWLPPHSNVYPTGTTPVGGPTIIVNLPTGDPHAAALAVANRLAVM